ncbi:endonuclease/exonuclease/phosphatase family protein [Oricola sp.]|uniref:endonuclease/exonuclease/phosphatase family protein n=1 Tax=Oricola sp. TaxID=1979950 RepID=UPI003515C412
MPTPLDVLFDTPENAPADGDVPEAAIEEMREYSAYLDGIIPPKREVDRNILIATWNIAHFRSLTRKWKGGLHDSPKRDYRCLWAITEILSRFDVVAVQEVGSDFRALRSAIKVLGPNWSFLMTDRAEGQGGNDEHMAYIFDTTRVALSGLAGELVVPDEAEEFGFDKGSFKKQFARNPYAVSFRTRDTTFILITAHIDYGDVTQERLPELRGIAKWMQSWAAREHRWHHNLIVLGDFNLERTGNELYEAFVSTGLEVPFILQSHPRTIYARGSDPEAESYHDQIAWFSKGESALLGLEVANGGIVEIWDRLLRDRHLPKGSFAFRISDHNPLWLEFRLA